MNVKGQTIQAAKELGELMAAIRYAYRYRAQLPASERWEASYAVIVGVASAASVTALSASSKHATAVISGSASVHAPSAPAEIDASMKVSFSKEAVDKLWRAPATGYAVQALRIKPSLFKRWDREDVVFVNRKSLVAPSSVRPPRPQSYAKWLVASSLDPVESASTLLTAADAAAALEPAAQQVAPRSSAKKKTKRR